MSTVIRYFVLYVVMCTALSLTACGGGGGGGGGKPTPTGTTIGPAGGTVTNGMAKVVIPAGALSLDTQIAVEQTSTGAPALPAGVTPVGEIYAFTPHGTTFAVPATITLPFDPNNVALGTELTIYKTNATMTDWVVVPGDRLGCCAG